MSLTQESDFQDVLARVRTWTPAMRLTLAEQLLRSLHAILPPDSPRGVPADQVRGIAAGEGPPPDDDTVKRWLHDRRMEKYG